MMILLLSVLIERFVNAVKINEYAEIIQSLLRENHELKKRVEIVEEILRCHLPIIEDEST